MSRIEPALTPPQPGGGESDQFHEVGVAVGDRGSRLLGAVGADHEHPVAALSVDVGDRLVLQPGLESPEPEETVVHGLGDGVLGLSWQRITRVGDRHPRLSFEGVVDASGSSTCGK